METKSSPGEASGYHHHHGIGPVISLFVLFAPSLLRLLCHVRILGGDYGRPEAQPARRLFFFTFLLHTLTRLACFLAVLFQNAALRYPRERKKQRKRKLL